MPLIESRTALVTVLSLALYIAPFAVCAQVVYEFDQPAQSLADALRAAGSKAGVNVAFQPESVRGRQAPALKGHYSAKEALERLIKGAGLVLNTTRGGSFLIEASNSRSGAGVSSSITQPDADSSVTPYEINPSRPDGGGEVLQQDVRSTQNSKSSIQRNQPGSSVVASEVTDMDTVVVTGSRIRGSYSPSPTQIYTRDQIELSGAPTLAKFIERLPQNFGGGASENTIAGITGAGSVNNTVSGTGVNLRGLGNAATLVLLNGQRIAPGNSQGDFIDVSMIPMSAVERVEVVTDGASAIYGSDAVGGVVNFILRRDFEGAESRLGYGSVTEGSAHQIDATQTFGRRWTGGSALLSYNYFNQAPLSAGDRDFTANVPLPFTLLPRQIRHSVLLSAAQEVGSRVELYGDTTFSRRSTSTFINNQPAYSIESPAEIEAYSGTLGAKVDLARQMQLELRGAYSSSRTDLEQTYRFGVSEVPGADHRAEYDIFSAEAIVNGPLWSTSAGTARFAAGSQFRTEDFGSENRLNPTRSFYSDRAIMAGYFELQIPLIGARMSGDSLERLTLTLADRYEHYDDFGSTNNPKVGIAWRAVPNLKFRGTYSTSFQAPALYQLNPEPGQVFPINIPDPAGGTQLCSPPDTGNTCTTVLLDIGGGNPDLKPQKSRNWTVGFDFESEVIRGLQASLTYYHITFRDQIGFPATLGGFTNSRILSLESLFGPSIVRRSPTQEEIASRVVGNPSFVNFFGIDPFSATVLFYGASNNLSILKSEGVDFSVFYTRPFGQTSLTTGVDGTYITKLEKQFVPGAPVINVLNTPYNPIDIRLRAHASVSRKQFTIGANVNYIDSYEDNRFVDDFPVASWTTVDLTLRYDFNQARSMWNTASILLAATNIFNRPPPFVASSGSFAGINYDGANANALGRLLRIQLTVAF